ncbi:MAG: hypothetical protein ISS56_06820 [Anaerolineae bacterium]|nr:hypothetical protein [Anaerolineae bacterium]
MSMNAPQMANVVCPACRSRYSAPVHNLIDVGREPRLKTLLLQGRLNVGICPSCGATGMLSVPVSYHDPDKELLFCLVPQELPMNENDRQRMIGEMSNAVIDSLPAEQRKGYLLRPRIFLSFGTMLESILGADGITREMLQAQREKIQLVEEMSQVVDDSLRLASLIAEHESKIDYELFSLLTASIDAAERNGQADAGRRLTELRERLLKQTSAGQDVARQQEAVEKALQGIDQGFSQEDLLDRVIAAHGEYEDSILSILISVARPLLDYRFFQLLTERIERAAREEGAASADTLRALREKLLDLTQRIDAEMRAQMQKKVQLLSEIARSPDPRRVIRERTAEIDEALISILEANIERSEEQHQHDASERFQAIREMIMELLEESAPPAIRFINQLLRADFPDETRKILKDNQAQVTQDLLNTIDALSQDFASRGEEQTSERLRGIMSQAQLMA